MADALNTGLADILRCRVREEFVSFELRHLINFALGGAASFNHWYFPPEPCRLTASADHKFT